MSFIEFDPLSAKSIAGSEAAIAAIKREISNILDSYVGWYDPFCELIQNALDSVDERSRAGIDAYEPKIRIIVNLKDNTLTVSDNGTGLAKDKYNQFLAPSFSFKSGNTRGHKGVGATYLAYGFNYIQICTKCGDFSAVGKMIGARNWLSDPTPPANPKVVPDNADPIDVGFDCFDQGASITIQFSTATRPKDLNWVQATESQQWLSMLSARTGLGSIVKNLKINTTIVVIRKDGAESSCTVNEVCYLWPHRIVNKHAAIRDVNKKRLELFSKNGATFKMPSKFTNIECLYDFYRGTELLDVIQCTGEEKEVIENYNPVVYISYVYSANVWKTYHDSMLKIRKSVYILNPGIQIATNNMPQGELYSIPLKRNIGRQNQMHVLLHFENCRADLGRKGFQKNLVEFAQSVAIKLLDSQVNPLRSYMRTMSGGPATLARAQKVDDWKEEFKRHELEHPLVISHESFFLPLKKISITSEPTREQDVIALFNQLVAGGVIRGVRIMSTNERFTYDSMFRVMVEQPFDLHVYDAKSNPLGVDSDNQIFSNDSFVSSPKILEYKYSLDGLIEDIEANEKNTNDLDLVVVWETGETYQHNYYITSILNPDNLAYREYHGVTHVLQNINSNQKELDIIVLSELIEFLADMPNAIEKQIDKYEN